MITLPSYYQIKTLGYIINLCYIYPLRAKMSEKLENKALAIVIFTTFLNVIGLSILLPVLPQLIREFFEPLGYSYNTSLELLGWLNAMFPLMLFFSAPVFGQLSDRYGRRPILIFSITGTAIGYALFAFALLTKNLPLLFFARALDGITGGNLTIARAVIADSSPPEHRTRNFGFMGACFGIGFILGPYMGAHLATPNASFLGLFSTPSWFTTATPFWFTAILSAINVLSVYYFLPETHKRINHLAKLTWGKAIENIRNAATSKHLRIIYCTEFLYWSGFTFFFTFFQVLLIQKLNFNATNSGDFFAYIGICMILTQFFVTPALAKRFKNYKILRFTYLATGFALFLQLWPSTIPQIFMVAPLFSFFNALTMANSSALISISSSSDIQGEVLGIQGSVQAVAQFIPSIIAGYVATLGINLPTIVGGSMMLIGGILFITSYSVPKTVLK